MNDDLARINHWKSRVADANKEQATLEGRLEGLTEQARKLKTGMKADFEVGSLKALEAKIEAQREKVKGMNSELEKVFES